MNERTPSFTGIPSHERILSGIEGMWRGKYALKDDMVSKRIEEFNRRQRLGGFNQNIVRDILQVV